MHPFFLGFLFLWSLERARLCRTLSFYEGYRKNRALFLSVVLLPLVGMIAVIPIVLWKAP